MLSIIYPYRNRDVARVKISLNSLLRQSEPNFEVVLLDYGSSTAESKNMKDLCGKYSFVKYQYRHTQFQPWNKSRALNSVIKGLETDFCFVADVDMIFHPDFVKRAKQLQQKDTSIYFQVGLLNRNEKIEGKGFADFKNYRKSSYEATGLSMFPVKLLKELRGFDEFYHFWGAEDTDMHVRLENSGYPVKFYDREVLLLHQWHSSYRSSEKDNLAKDLQVKGIVQFNHRHLERARDQRKRQVNNKVWGECLQEGELRDLEEAPISLEINNETSNINHLLYANFSEATAGIVKVIIKRADNEDSLKYKIKKILGKKVPQFYSLKEVNDVVLLHLISFYRDNPYIFRVSDDLEKIEVAIKFQKN